MSRLIEGGEVRRKIVIANDNDHDYYNKTQKLTLWRLNALQELMDDLDIDNYTVLIDGTAPVFGGHFDHVEKNIFIKEYKKEVEPIVAVLSGQYAMIIWSYGHFDLRSY